MPNRKQMEQARIIIESFGFVKNEKRETEQDASVITIQIKDSDGAIADIDIGKERSEAAEVLFRPRKFSLTSTQTSLPETIVRSLRQCDRALRTEFASNIILTGGPSMLPGFKERLLSELRPLMKTDFSIYTTEAQGTYIGGCLQCKSMPHSQWVSRDEYEKYGGGIIRKKCF